MTKKKFIRSVSAAVFVAGLAVPLAVSSPAEAQLTVYDPTNYVQNVLQAARSLEQINNQIKQIENQATSLVNEAKNLASLPFSSLQELQKQVQQTQQLLSQAQKIAYDVEQIDQAFTSKYSASSMSGSQAQLVANSKERWETSVASFQDALKVQAGVVGNIEGSRSAMDSLVTASQSATGALQAAQAGNQLLALQSQQIADLVALVAANGRAQALESARGTAAEAEARERFRRFLGSK